MNLTYEFRLLPSRKQHRALEALLESQRELYNAALQERVGAYRCGFRLTYFDQTRSLTELRQTDPEFAAIPVSIQRATLRRLNEAYKGFFRRAKSKGEKAGFPRFKGTGRWRSFGFSEFVGISFDGKGLRFKGIPGPMRVHMHRPLAEQSQIRSCVFRRDTKGWKVGFVLEIPCGRPKRGHHAVGVDLGIAPFATLSNGTVIRGIRAARRSERRLRLLQRALSRKKSQSKGRLKAVREVARCHAKTARIRSNFLHGISAWLVRAHETIAVEALTVSRLARGPLARDVHDAGWAKFVGMLRYKAERAGVRLVEVSPFNTSQDCSGCGSRVVKGLSCRLHVCGLCGLVLDRDLNAARNILARAGVGPGPRNVAEEGMRADGNPS